MTASSKASCFLNLPRHSPFSIHNLPYGVVQPKGASTSFCAIAIGDWVLNLTALEYKGIIKTGPVPLFQAPSLNAFMAQGKTVWVQVRHHIQTLLSDTPASLQSHGPVDAWLTPLAEVSALLPAHIGDYTDFYSSKEHATNIGLMIRDKTQPLLPNWHHLPVGYHGRASSILASPHPIQRPWGQIRPQEDLPPLLSPSKRLDFELEVAYFVGPGNLIGRPISVDDASDHIFGLVLLNDWSARDIQRWEYQPLGPFVSKSFATSISPWVIPMLALEPFRVPLPPCEVPLLPYLTPSPHKPLWGLDMALEVSLKVGDTATVLTRSNTKYLHWSMAQQLAHHTITGCNVRPGDLMASGTISGPTPDSYGSLMELSWNATKPLSCGAHTRTFLEDGDEVIMTGWCEGLEGRVGFGDLRGQILA